MWKAPNRPDKQISQTFNDGIVTVYAVRDKAEPGHRPDRELVKKTTLRFAERRLGVQRYYSGKQNQIEISQIIRVQKRKEISNQDIAIIEGVQYRIDMVQHAFNVYPACMDLTLTTIEQKYKIKGDDEP